MSDEMKPSQIREYYIAYVDILGYKEFFKSHKDDIPNLLERVNKAIADTKDGIETFNSLVPSGITMETMILSKMFSDNILLCIEASGFPLEQARILLLLQTVANIQRDFVNRYGLFLRGGVTKGELSFNDDYVFGQGLITAVGLEEKVSIYPRIVIDDSIMRAFDMEALFPVKDLERANDIERRVQAGESISDDDMSFYSDSSSRIALAKYMGYAIKNLAQRWDDGHIFVNYLKIINAREMYGNQLFDQFYSMLYPGRSLDDGFYYQSDIEQESILSLHKRQVEKQLRLYGHNNDIDSSSKNAESEAAVREHVLKKYIWLMAYHNRVCVFTANTSHFINTECNCDSRYLRMVVNVIDTPTDEPIDES